MPWWCLIFGVHEKKLMGMLFARNFEKKTLAKILFFGRGSDFFFNSAKRYQFK